MTNRDKMASRRVGRMNTSSSPEAIAPIPMHELRWSPAEKAAARKAFDLALGRELQEVTREAQQRAARIEEPSELWELERFLTKHRQEIDRKYDYRYSVLPLVFTILLREGRLSEEDLKGLGNDKLSHIRLGAAL
jgi:hypothetical protein